MKYINKIRRKLRYEYQLYIERRFPPDNFVLVFHDVIDDGSSEKTNYSISISEFKEFVNILLDEINGIESVSNLPSRGVYFTFDDGFVNTYNNAFPILDEYSIPYIVFIPVDFIGKDGYLDEGKIRELTKRENATIGGHSFSHANMFDCTSEELHKELYESKTQLEALIGKRVEYMAYPYGSMIAVDGRAIKKAKEAGYKYAFSTVQTTGKKPPNELFYSRITVKSSNYLDVIELIRNKADVR